jgi:uncharacterized protein GlcG (DUF336 family)
MHGIVIRVALGGVLALGMMCGAGAQLLDRKALSLAEARKIVAAAETEATKSNLTVAIAVVDEGGHLLLFERMDDTQIGSVEVAIAKARSAFLFRRPSKVFEDAVAGGRNALLRLDGAMPFDGGVPLTVAGRVIGAIGISGGTGQQDGQVANAGAAALAK